MFFIPIFLRIFISNTVYMINQYRTNAFSVQHEEEQQQDQQQEREQQQQQPQHQQQEEE